MIHMAGSRLQRRGAGICNVNWRGENRPDALRQGRILHKIQQKNTDKAKSKR